MDFNKKSIIIILVITLFIASFTARFYKLGEIGIWADEGYSAFIAKKNPSRILEYLKSDSNPPFYYLLLSLFLKFSDSVFMLRLPSAIAGCLFVVIIYFLGKELFDAETGFWSSFVAGLSPLFIFYSQEARNYALLALLSLCCFYFFIRISHEKRLVPLIGYTTFTMLLLYTHNLGLFVFIAAMICGILAGYYRKKFIKGWLLANTFVIISYLPWIFYLIIQAKESQRSIGWIQSFWDNNLAFRAIPESLHAFCMGGYVQSYVGIRAIDKLQPLVIALHVVLVIILVLFLKYKASASIRRNLMFVTIFLFVPLVLTWATSFKIPVYLPGRTDMAVFGFFSLIVGLACTNIKGFHIKTTVLVILSIIALMTLYPYYHSPDRMNDKNLSDLLLGLAKDDDIVIFTGLTIPSISYYLDHSDKKIEYLFFPSEMVEHLGHFDPKPFMKNKELLQHEIKLIIEYLRQNLIPGKIVWIIHEDHFINSELLRRIKNEFFTHYDGGDKIYSLFLLNRPVKIYGFKK